VLDAGIGWVALVVIADRFALEQVEHGVALSGQRLNLPHLGAVVGHQEGVDRGVRVVVGVDLWRSGRPLRARVASRRSSGVRSAGNAVAGSSVAAGSPA